MKYLDYPELELLSRALTFETADVRIYTRLEAYSCKAVSRERRLLRALEEHYAARAAAQRDAHDLLSRSVDGVDAAGGAPRATGGAERGAAPLLSASVPCGPAPADLSLSPSFSLPEGLVESLPDSAFGPLDDPQARKVLFTLITALNLAFPDHDFSAVNPADFRAEPSPHGVLSSLSTTLRHLSSTSGTPRSFSALPGAIGSVLSGVGSPSSPTMSSSLPHSGRGIGAQLACVVDDIMDTNDCEVYTFHPSLEADPHASGEADADEMEPAPLGVGSEYDDLGSEDDWAQEAHAMPPAVPIHHGNRCSPGHGNGNRLGLGDREARLAHKRTRSEHLGDDLVFDEDYQGGFGSDESPDSPASDASDSEADEKGSDDEFDASHTQRGDFGGVDAQGAAGGNVLWTTYAFFYNRRLKRLLFVNVWARRASDVPLPVPAHSPAVQPMRRASQASSTPLPAFPAFSSAAPALAQVRGPPQAAPHPASFAAAGAALKPPSSAPHTPARRALERGAGSRQPSRSPGPSANSPFPHDSPRGSPSVLRRELHP